jgi:hypothetical protein
MGPSGSVTSEPESDHDLPGPSPGPRLPVQQRRRLPVLRGPPPRRGGARPGRPAPRRRWRPGPARPRRLGRVGVKLATKRRAAAPAGATRPGRSRFWQAVGGRVRVRRCGGGRRHLSQPGLPASANSSHKHGPAAQNCQHSPIGGCQAVRRPSGPTRISKSGYDYLIIIGII